MIPLYLTVSYLVGAIPFGLLVGRLSGVDVRSSGSGNIGATNVSRLLGKKLGVITLLLDLIKGFAPTCIAALTLSHDDNRLFLAALCGLAAVIGHMFPVYLRFKGGKGVATALGVFLFLKPLAILISLVVFIASVALSGFVSVGSLAASGLIPLWIALLNGEPRILAVTVVIAALIWFQHRSNIMRLIRGEEKSWKKGKNRDQG
ncbi:MAG: glycerol-3-phosphate 1-O-acyltransferase PlsY [Thermodesulfobacteriota bacterium]